MQHEPDNKSKADYLTFFIAGEEYGVPILRVREILEFDTLTRVPAAPPCVRGVINLRGSVVPVADLAIQFGQPQCAITKLTCVVVVEVAMDGELAVMGLMVESVNQTIQLSDADIESTPAFGTLARTDYLLGMGNIGKKFVLLLDIDRVLSADELHSVSLIPPPIPVGDAVDSDFPVFDEPNPSEFAANE
jgi:purine-binding chemotaxis protein CheW